MPRVLIAENETLLGAAIQSLLAGEPDLDMICISAQDQAELVQEIDRCQPHVIILGEPSDLIQPAQLLTFLRDYPKLRVVVINVDHSLVRIYDKQEVSLKRPIHLVEILRANQTVSG